MKVLIWIGCIIGAGMLQVILVYAGISGAIPAVIVFGGMIYFARSLCKEYDEKQEKEYCERLEQKKMERTQYIAEQPKKADVPKTALPPVMYCRKCGKALVGNSTFCSYCGTEIVKE